MSSCLGEAWKTTCLGVSYYPQISQFLIFISNNSWIHSSNLNFANIVWRILLYILCLDHIYFSCSHVEIISFVGSLPLPWSIRMKIALGAAKGLAFLHEEAERPVIYRDFKTSNILLDAVSANSHSKITFSSSFSSIFLIS